jgi:sulfide:quinone oxidoreductase
VDVAGRRVHLDSGASLPFEVLVVATGAALQPGETEGLAEAMARGKAFTFYEPAGAAALRDALAGFDGGADRDQRRRHADQVPGCPDRVRLPC